MTEIWHLFNQRPDNGRWVLIYSRATKTPSVIKMAECITLAPIVFGRIYKTFYTQAAWKYERYDG